MIGILQSYCDLLWPILRWFKFKLKFDIQFEGPPVGMYDVPGAGRQETW